MGHLYPEALFKMREYCQGVSISTTKLLEHRCEECCLNDSKRVPYRFPALRSTVPYEKVHWDLISIKNGMGGECYVLHFIDSCSRMHYVYQLLGKGQRYVLPAF